MMSQDGSWAQQHEEIRKAMGDGGFVKLRQLLFPKLSE